MRQRNIKNSVGGGIKRKMVLGHSLFSQIIGLENLFLAWDEFRRGKSKKSDVQLFEYYLEDNIFNLHYELKTKNYQHSHYTVFCIKDPKLRKIHKAIIKDRVLHHAVFRVLYPIFDKIFIADSYSCRLGKGTHRAIDRLEKFARQVSQNKTKTIFILKCDVKRFFDSIDQNILMGLLKKKIQDQDVLRLLGGLIKSFEASEGRGLPLGNITSQLFANIYLNGLDQFVKHKLRVRHYIRYCDDFVVLSQSQSQLENIIAVIGDFLQNRLDLSLHPNKIEIKKWHQGVDFLGYISFPHHRLLRTKTKKRMLKKIQNRFQQFQYGEIYRESFEQSLQSYIGILKHCASYKIRFVFSSKKR